MPKVSVVVPSYNYAHCLSQAIESVLSQTFRDFELIVVNDGSIDDTHAVVASYGDAIRYVRQENRGLPGARNTGIRVASGQYVAFLDPDDLWLPLKLERQVLLLDAQPEYGLVYCNSYFVDGNTGQICGTYYSDALRSGWILPDLFTEGVFIGAATPIVRHKVLIEVGGYDESLKPPTHGPEDWDLYMRIASKYQIGVVREVLACYRLHLSSMMGTYPDYMQWYRGNLRVIDKISSTYPEKLLPLRDCAIGKVTLGLAKAMIQAGQFEAIRRILRYSLSHNLLHPRNYWYLLASILGQFLRSDRVSAREHFLKAKAAVFREAAVEARRHFLGTIRADPIGYPEAYIGFLLSMMGQHAGIDVLRGRWHLPRTEEMPFFRSDCWKLPERI